MLSVWTRRAGGSALTIATIAANASPERDDAQR